MSYECRSYYAIGDIVEGAPLDHKASYEGKVAAAAISGEKSAVDYLAMPAVVFSDPEIAIVGYTEEEAKEKGFKAKASKFPFRSEEHTSELQSRGHLVCRLLLEKKKKQSTQPY